MTRRCVAGILQMNSLRRPALIISPFPWLRNMGVAELRPVAWGFSWAAVKGSARAWSLPRLRPPGCWPEALVPSGMGLSILTVRFPQTGALRGGAQHSGWKLRSLVTSAINCWSHRTPPGECGRGLHSMCMSGSRDHWGPS